MERLGDDISTIFQPVVPNVITVRSEQVEVTSSDISPAPIFSHNPDTHVTDFDFEVKIQQLPFKLNMGEKVELTYFQ